MPFHSSRGRLSTAAYALAGLAMAVGLVLAAGIATGDGPLAGPAARLAASHAPTYPSSMDALGGSVTVGFNTNCPDPWTDCPDNSWATGTNPIVDSVYLRLLALNPQLRDHNANDAESGTTMADLDQQAQNAVSRDAELVLIAMGTNDACGGRGSVMTEVSVFRDEFTRAMDTLTAGLPGARVHVLSIPDLYQRWQSFHTIPRAVKAWRSIPFCPTLLTHPTSNAPADVARRAAVRARVLDFNSVLAQVCAHYPRCTTDGGAAFRAPVIAAEFSTHDYWHPNIAGQATLARLVWDTLE
jgi:lysophospholipase L1-like esterase